jgi:hypothetical protein
MVHWSRGAMVAAAVLTLGGVGGCGDDPMIADVQWQLRCPPGVPACLPSAPRTVTGQRNDPGIGFRCRVSNLDGDRRILDLLVNDAQSDGGATGSLELDTVVFQDGQDGVSGRVVINEAGSVFRGDVGTAHPCQVTNVRTERTDDGRALMGEILCRGIADPVSPSRVRDVTSTASTAEPATFSVVRCDGM